MQKLIKLANRILWLLIVVVFVLIIVRMINPAFLAGHSELNELPANIAGVLFLAVLLPGTFQRMGMNNVVVRLGIMWRRTLGVLMYLAALTHVLFLLDHLPWFSEGLIKNFDALTASGFMAIILVLPVLLTSNNMSVRFFKKHWKILQRITYIALPLIAIHVWQSDEIVLASTYIVVSIIILLSFFMGAHRRNQSVLRTAMTILFVVALAAFVAYSSLRLLFKNADDAVREETLLKSNVRVEELIQENITLKQTIKANEEKVKEFDRIESEKKAAAERAEKQAEEKRKAEEEAAAKAAAEAALLDYESGVYTANGPYVTDKGKLHESLDVTLAIDGDVVRSVRLVGHLTKKKSEKYHGRFEKDISGVVVGRNIDTLNINAIGGASDTSAGFRAALAKIKAQARK